MKNPKTVVINISNGKLLRLLTFITLSLLLTHLLLQFLNYQTNLPLPDTLVGRLDVDNEISIPTWWSQLLLFIPAALGVFAYKAARYHKHPGAGWWLAFSALFVFLSMDEGAMLHEAFITKFREWTTDGTATGLANHLWLIPVVVVFCLLLIPFIKFVRTLPKRAAALLAAGVGTFALGAIVYETFGLIMFSDASPFLYHGVNVAIEEALEMSGACITIYGVLEYLRLRAPITLISLRE